MIRFGSRRCFVCSCATVCSVVHFSLWTVDRYQLTSEYAQVTVRDPAIYCTHKFSTIHSCHRTNHDGMTLIIWDSRGPSNSVDTITDAAWHQCPTNTGFLSKLYRNFVNFVASTVCFFIYNKNEQLVFSFVLKQFIERRRSGGGKEFGFCQSLNECELTGYK